MSLIATMFGLVLVLLGLAGYGWGLSQGAGSVTALIPSFFGIVLTGLGIGGMKLPKQSRHFMHAAAALALLGILGTVGGVIGAARWIGGTEPARPAAVVVQSIMCLLLVVFLAWCIKSFVDARRARRLEGRGFEPLTRST
jgi:hypothetical protein